MNDRTSQWRATSGRLSVKQNGRRGAKIFFKRTIDDFVDGQENKNTRAKTDGDVGLLKPFLQREVELRNIEKIPPDQLHELLSEFVFTVRSKDGNYYEATSWLWKRHLCLAQQF